MPSTKHDWRKLAQFPRPEMRVEDAFYKFGEVRIVRVESTTPLEPGPEVPQHISGRGNQISVTKNKGRIDV